MHPGMDSWSQIQIHVKIHLQKRIQTTIKLHVGILIQTHTHKPMRIDAQIQSCMHTQNAYSKPIHMHNQLLNSKTLKYLLKFELEYIFKFKSNYTFTYKFKCPFGTYTHPDSNAYSKTYSFRY